MNSEDIRAMIRKGTLSNELELQKAIIADRKLRLLAKEDSSLKKVRSDLRKLNQTYEEANWADESKITDQQIEESDLAEKIAEAERQFVQRRKEMILSKLEKLNLKQQDLCTLLDHNKSYISELLNGIRSFSSGDLVIIHRLLKIDLEDLFPTTIPLETQKRIRQSLANISSQNIKLNKITFELRSSVR
jgi:transcriptional regulator with XRE-family HTH domain